MSEPFIAQISIFGGNFAPRGWALCNGQILAISQNTALFALLGTNYGGDGRTNFALPNLQDRTPMGTGQGPGLTDRFIGEQDGRSTVSLLQTEIPGHTHSVGCDSAAGTLPDAGGHVWGAVAGRGRPPLYAASGNTSMSPQAIGTAGLGLPHNNRSPFLGLTFIIAMIGIFPSRN